MKIGFKTLSLLAILFLFEQSWAEESKPQWDCAGDRAYCEVEEGEESSQSHRDRYEDDFFLAPRYYNYDNAYKEPVPAPDWPGANNTFMEQLSR